MSDQAMWKAVWIRTALTAPLVATALPAASATSALQLDGVPNEALWARCNGWA
jgi:hypothetical protein